MSGVDAVFSQSLTNRTIELENWYTLQKRLIEQSGKSEEEKYLLMEKLDKDFAEKKRQAERDNAQKRKAMNIAQATMDAAAGIVATIKNVGFPFAIPLIAIQSALALAQIALIAKQPIPLAKGGIILKQPTLSQDGGFLGGEAGQEIVAPLADLPRVMSDLGYTQDKNKGVDISAILGAIALMHEDIRSAWSSLAAIRAQPIPLEKGGILDRPTFSYDGRNEAGERGREAVIPPDSREGRRALGGEKVSYLTQNIYLGGKLIKQIVTEIVQDGIDSKRIRVKSAAVN
jgi:hypothetical protein